MLNRASLLLPPNRSALESAVVDALHTLEHPERLLSTLYNPDAVAAPLLPWLAWGRDVLAWPSDADETQRRQLTARSWHLHRRMGTLSGLRELAAVFGGTITKAITPPAKLYAAPALTVAERNAFVSRYPQLRIYRHRVEGVRQGAMLQGAFLGAAFPAVSDAVLRVLPRVYRWNAGQEMELTAVERTTTSATGEAITITEVREGGRAGHLAFVGTRPRFLATSTAAQRMYRLRLTQDYTASRDTVHRTLAQPGLEPIEMRFDDVAQAGHAAGVFMGCALRGALRKSTARDRLYQRLYLFDPSVAVLARTAGLHLNQGRLGMPAHHAELDLRVRGKVNPKAAGRFVQGHLLAQPQAVLAKCLESMRAAARASDRIAINTTVSRQSTAGEQHFAGAIVAGEWTQN